ncbi:MAG: ACP S-malonyltransferase [Candidatus Cloacimonetes bacterium]|nr:ACP S-malonyltransferase [Candidatus Cloacimonadota bacterium]MBL7085714.1 ACP S-malonyltransferase [Candidatus Cloacimonadota bacterium]
MNINNVAFVFPGQGAQYVGMTKEFYDISEYRHYFDKANKKLGYDLKNIMFEGPMEELKQTHNTQPAILLHSILILKYFQKQCKIEPKFVAGHSLGEFSALVVTNVLDWEDALYLVHKRGKFMIEASKGVPFKMAAIIGLNKDIIVEICNNISGTVIAANFNTPIQTVISGEVRAVSEAIEKCKNAGAKRVVELVVGGAFHSPLIAKSAEWLNAEMNKISFKTAKIPVISNFKAKPETEPKEIMENLTQQIKSPVRWVESVEYMIKNGVDTFVEFGPGKIVSGMIKAIDRNTKRYNIDRIEHLEKVLDEINNY